MDVCGTKCLRRHEELKEDRLAHSLARHRATIINYFFDTYNKLVANLPEEYYKQDIDLDTSILDLNDLEVDTHIIFYRQNFHRYREVALSFLSVKSLIDSLKHITQDM